MFSYNTSAGSLTVSGKSTFTLTSAEFPFRIYNGSPEAIRQKALQKIYGVCERRWEIKLILDEELLLKEY